MNSRDWLLLAALREELYNNLAGNDNAPVKEYLMKRVKELEEKTK